MQGITHGATVAGFSSALTTGWIRSQVQAKYDPNVSPPSLSDRVRRRAPLAVAGLSFVGLSTIVSYKFDSLESDIFDSDQINFDGNHRDLHSVPIVGGAYGAAQIIKYAASNVGESTATYLDISDRSNRIARLLESLADWILNSTAVGSFGHFAGDLPTSGRGVTALRLLKPLSQRNFNFHWITHDATPWNKYLQLAGFASAGAAWSVSGLYLLSWQPPKEKISDYISKLCNCDSYSSMKNQVITDIEDIFAKFLKISEDYFWESPLFKNSPNKIRQSPENNWYQMDYDLKEILNVESSDYSKLADLGILPQDIKKLINDTSIYRPQTDIQTDNIPVFNELASDAESILPDDSRTQKDSIIKDSPENTDDLSHPDHSGTRFGENG